MSHIDVESDTEMNPQEDISAGISSTPNIIPQSSGQPIRHASAQQDFLFRAPERERGAVPSPSKFTALRKRQLAVDNIVPPPLPRSEVTADSSITDRVTNFRQSDRTTIQRLSDENVDLRHQISVLCAQLTNFQTSMTSQIGSLSAQVTNLSQQLARKSAAASTGNSTTVKTYSSAGTARTYTVPGAPPPPPAKKTLKLSVQKQPAVSEEANPAVREPENTTYAAVAAATSDSEKAFTIVSRKKKNQFKGPLKPLYDPNDQKVIIQIHPDTPPQTTIQMTWQYLQMANRAVREYQKGPDYCFVRCHVTQKQNLVLQTCTKTKGTDYLPYLDAIKAKIEQEAKLQVTSIEGEPRWSKFLLHGVPISATMEDVAISIQQSYPGVLKLAQTPRWLTTESKQQTSGKGMSTVVLAIAGKHTLQSLGYQYLFVCNSRCRLDRYLPFGPSSQCGNCCKFGHPTTMCQDQKPTCGVCGKEHHTRYHPCPAPDCKGGGRCTHTPMHCVNCNNNLHTSIHPQCPTREKVRQQKLNLGIITEFNTTVQLDPNVTATNQAPPRS